METRTITEYKIYALKLSHVKGGVDRLITVAIFDDYDKLVSWISSQKEQWKDEEKSTDFYGRNHGYDKAFKKGSALEWYNPPTSMFVNDDGSCNDFGGICSAWVRSLDFGGIPFNPQ